MNKIHSFNLVRLDNFAEYLILENAFLPHEIENIHKLWSKDAAANAQIEGDKDSPENEEIRKSKVISMTPDSDNSWIYQRLSQIAHQCNNHSYFFNIVGFYEPLQFAEYKKDDFFDWHLDFGTGDSSTRKLSITVQLSDSDQYEGGDLQFRINNKEVTAPREKGTAIVFPSFIMHRVTPITSGSRRSLVGWVSGNHYR